METLLAQSLIKILPPAAVIVGSIIGLFFWVRHLSKEQSAIREKTLPDIKKDISSIHGLFELMRDERDEAWKSFMKRTDFEAAIRLHDENTELKMSNKVLQMQSKLLAEIQKVQNEIQRLAGKGSRDD